MISLENEEMRMFIEAKIDEAVDIVDEATLRKENLSSDAKRELWVENQLKGEKSWRSAS